MSQPSPGLELPRNPFSVWLYFASPRTWPLAHPFWERNARGLSGFLCRLGAHCVHEKSRPLNVLSDPLSTIAGLDEAAGECHVGGLGVSRRVGGKACQGLELARQGKVGTICAKCWGQEALGVCSRKFYLESRSRAESWALRSHSEEFESGHWAEGTFIGF